jgi:2'-hydroxyisoflavone reductase
VKLLLLGGPKFLGRAIADATLARGHELTFFNRGRTNPELYPEAEKLHGDRDGDLSALDGHAFDVVVDTSGYLPRVVRDSAELMSAASELYVFVSSISVYGDFSQPVDEGSALADIAQMSSDELAEDHSNYGALKALCERDATEAFADRALNVRAGLIVGPHDPTGRFTYWPHRVAHGGEVLAPGPPDRPVQFVDVRDLSDWIVLAAEHRRTGPFNVTGRPLPFARLLEACRGVTGADSTPTWVPEAFLLEQGVEQWMELPLWLAAEPGWEHFLEVPVSKALDAGLRFRPLEETVTGALERAGLVDGVGLTHEREAELLAAWHAR